MTSVSLGGTEIAAYSYDESEQRIIKTAANQTTHYHYDLEGRLIAETDGTTGETLREYVWLGLMPIAVIAQTESEPEGECNPVLIEALEAELATTTAAADALLAQIIDWDGNIEFREAKIAEMRAQLDGLSGKKREKLEDKIEKWESLIISTEAKRTEAEAELVSVSAQIADIEEALTTEQAICSGEPTGMQAGIFYLHADHLGRPQFATDEAGMTVWDMGEGVTPFGEGVNLAGAFAQKLMFPGQYADEETGEEIVLSHNWHRTYDPTLGRYLQSDPIGLAGGLNRYAYVGGNPVGRIDPDGQIFLPIFAGMALGALVDIGFQMTFGRKSVECLNVNSILISAGLGVIPGVSFIKPIAAIKNAAKTQNGIRRFIPKFSSHSKKEAIDDLLVSSNAFVGSIIVGNEISKRVPEESSHDLFKNFEFFGHSTNDNCDCRNSRIN